MLGHILDRNAATPVRLVDYARVSPVGNFAQLCIHLGIDSKTAARWGNNGGKLIPWLVWVRIKAKWGECGFHPVKVALPPHRRPFRLPPHFIEAPAVEPHVPPSKDRPTLVDAMQHLARAVEHHIDYVVQRRFVRLQEEFKALTDLVLEAAGQKPNGNGQQSTPPPITVMRPVEAPAPKAAALGDVLREVQQRALPGKVWTGSPKAAREFSKLDPKSRALYHKVLVDVAEADDTRWWDRFGSKKVSPVVARKFEEGDVWALKVSKKLRLLIARNGAERRIVGFPARKDHTLFRSER